VLLELLYINLILLLPTRKFKFLQNTLTSWHSNPVFLNQTLANIEWNMNPKPFISIIQISELYCK